MAGGEAEAVGFGGGEAGLQGSAVGGLFAQGEAGEGAGVVQAFDGGAEHGAFGVNLPFVRADVAQGALLLPVFARRQRPGVAAVVPLPAFDAAFEGVSFAEEFGYEGVFR